MNFVPGLNAAKIAADTAAAAAALATTDTTMWILVKNSVENAMRVRQHIGNYETAANDKSGDSEGACGTFVPPTEDQQSLAHATDSRRAVHRSGAGRTSRIWAARHPVWFSGANTAGIIPARPCCPWNCAYRTFVCWPDHLAFDPASTIGRTGLRWSAARINGRSIDGTLTPDNVGLPVISLHGTGNWAVFTPDGGKLLEASGDAPHQARLVGTRLFVNESGDSVVRRWQQYNLRTGAKGDVCDFDMGSGYLGTDGSVGVFSIYSPQSELSREGT